MTFTLPKLSYSYDALEPYLSKGLVSVHYGKRTKKYFDTMNELIKGTSFEDYKTLSSIIESGLPKKGTKLYNVALQAYNHSLYWENLTPHNKSGEPSKTLLVAIEQQWKTIDKMIEQFNDTANKHFSNGWCWLVLKQDKLDIVDTHDADHPSGKVLLVIDFWEHSHELQYPAARNKYLDNIWPIVNWSLINERYATASER